MLQRLNDNFHLTAFFRPALQRFFRTWLLAEYRTNCHFHISFTACYSRWILPSVVAFRASVRLSLPLP